MIEKRGVFPETYLGRELSWARPWSISISAQSLSGSFGLKVLEIKKTLVIRVIEHSFIRKCWVKTGLQTGLEWVADQQWLNTIENNEFAQTQKLDGVVQVGLDLFHKWYDWILIGASIFWPKPIMNIIENAQKANLALGQLLVIIVLIMMLQTGHLHWFLYGKAK